MACVISGPCITWGPPAHQLEKRLGMALAQSRQVSAALKALFWGGLRQKWGPAVNGEGR